MAGHRCPTPDEMNPQRMVNTNSFSISTRRINGKPNSRWKVQSEQELINHQQMFCADNRCFILRKPESPIVWRIHPIRILNNKIRRGIELNWAKIWVSFVVPILIVSNGCNQHFAGCLWLYQSECTNYVHEDNKNTAKPDISSQAQCKNGFRHLLDRYLPLRYE